MLSCLQRCLRSGPTLPHADEARSAFRCFAASTTASQHSQHNTRSTSHLQATQSFVLNFDQQSSCVQTFRREHDRFWILAAHPEINLLAAGHDSGMIVFKLARERPPHAVHGSDAFFVAHNVIKHYDLKSGRADAIQSLPKPVTLSPKAAVVRSVSYNPAENALLLNTDEEGGTFKLFKLPAMAGGAGRAAGGRGEVAPDYYGLGTTAVRIPAQPGFISCGLLAALPLWLWRVPRDVLGAVCC